MTPPTSTQSMDVDPAKLDPDRPTYDEFGRRWAGITSSQQYERYLINRGVSAVKARECASLWWKFKQHPNRENCEAWSDFKNQMGA